MVSDPPLAQCPICGMPGELAWRPFCSRRCSDADLGRWLSGSYALPGDPMETVDPADSGEETGVH